MRVLFLLLFPVFCSAQTFVKDRFIAKDGAVLWSEKFEMKDMDTPIVVQNLTEKLRSKPFIEIDNMQQEGVFEGSIFAFANLTKAQFRVDFLYESYIVTVSSVVIKTDTEEIPLEIMLLKTNGNFMAKLPDFIEKFDAEMVSLFLITH